MELLSFLIFIIGLSFINLLLIPLAFIKLKSIIKKSHRNFWLALLQLNICLIGLAISNLIMAISILLKPKENLDARILHKAGNILGTLFCNCLPAIFFLIVIERLYATIKSETYEKSKCGIFIIIGSSICWLYAIFNILSWNVWMIDVSILIPISFGIDIAVVLATLILWKVNSNLKIIHFRTKLELSHRYQIDENIRMIQFVLPYLLIGTACLLVSGLITEKIHILDNADFYTSPMVYFSMMNPFICLIFGFDILAKGLPWLLFPKRNHRLFFQRRRVWVTTDLVEKDKDFHFKQLNTAWN